MPSNLEEIRLNFTPESLVLLNILIAYIMFGVAITLKKENFTFLFRHPKPVITGFISQFILLPLLTFLLISVLDIPKGIGLGMILVAACPGGNVSNFFSLISKGNAALSISLTAIATVAALFLTPFNFDFYSGLYLHGEEGLNFKLEFFDVLKSVVLIIGIPLVLGLWVGSRFPVFVQKSNKYIRISSFLILIIFIGVAFAKNLDFFLEYIGLIFWVVLLHNIIAFLSGYGLAYLFGNKDADRRSITMETGIQNSGLALIIIFTFMNGNGAMALIAAWWGIWHIIAGGVLSFFWKKKALRD